MLTQKLFVSVTFWGFNQLRFCPLDKEDNLPFRSPGTSLVGGVWDRQNRYHWNETITTHFSSPGTNILSECIYPCFDTSWPLRERPEITSNLLPSMLEDTQYYWVMFAVYFIVSSSGLASLTIFIVRMKAQTQARQRDRVNDIELEGVEHGTQRRSSLGTITQSAAWNLHGSFEEDFNKAKDGWQTALSRPFELKNMVQSCWTTWWLIVHIYAKVLSPISLILFIVFAELTIKVDLPGEGWRNIGQWGPFVAAVVIFIPALMDAWPKVKEWIINYFSIDLVVGYYTWL
jgi:hypothetical protein